MGRGLKTPAVGRRVRVKCRRDGCFRWIKYFEKKTKILTFMLGNSLILELTLVQNQYVASTLGFVDLFTPVQIRKNRFSQLRIYDKTSSRGSEHTNNRLIQE